MPSGPVFAAAIGVLPGPINATSVPATSAPDGSTTVPESRAVCALPVTAKRIAINNRNGPFFKAAPRKLINVSTVRRTRDVTAVNTVLHVAQHDHLAL